MSAAGYRDPLEALQGLLAAMEAQAALAGSIVEHSKAHGATLRDHEGRLAELEEAWQSLTLEIGRITRRARLLVNMKAATLVQTCQRCGNEYAHEPGPELCGACWVELGRPERYLRPAEPA